MICPRCGHDYPEEAQRCERCGWQASQSLFDAWEVHGIEPPLVGREVELAILNEIFQRTADYESPHAVTILGPAGVGKSRLVSEFSGKLSDAKAKVLIARGDCHQNSDSSYALISRLLRSRFSISEADEAQGAINKLKSEITRSHTDHQPQEMLYFLARFLGLQVPDLPLVRFLGDAPEQINHLASAVLRRFLEADASSRPLILVLENLHWATEESLGLVEYLIKSLEGSPVMTICTAWPSLLARRPHWFDRQVEHRRVDLEPLSPMETSRLLRSILHRVSVLPEDLLAEAEARTGGNPLFLEQVVRVYLEQGAIRTDGESWRIDADRWREIQLPITVEEAAQARVDSLDSGDRDILSRAAAVGNIFWLGAVVALTRLDQVHQDGPYGRWRFSDEELRSDILGCLTELTRRDVLMRMPDSTFPEDVEFVFKHGTERDAAINRLDPPARQRYQLLIGQWLEQKGGDMLEEHYEYIASLFDGANTPARAAEYYVRAGDMVKKRYLNERAVLCYTRSLELLDKSNFPLQMHVLHDLGSVYELTGKVDKALECFNKLLEISWLLDNKAKGGVAHNRLGRVYRTLGDYDRAMEHLQRGHTLFYQAGDRRGVASSLDDMGKVYWMRGRNEEALEQYHHSLEIRRDLGGLQSIALSLNNIGLVEMGRGAFASALRNLEESLDLRRRAGDRQGEASSLQNLGQVYRHMEKNDRALDLWEQTLSILKEIGDRPHQADILCSLGEIHLRFSDHSKAVTYLDQAVKIAKELGEQLILVKGYRTLAEASLAVDQLYTAQDYIKHSLSVATSLDSPIQIGQSLRVQGQILLAISKSDNDDQAKDQAEKAFIGAVSLLEEVGNEVELQRALLAQAKYYDANGMAPQAVLTRERAAYIASRLRGQQPT